MRTEGYSLIVIYTDDPRLKSMGKPVHIHLPVALAHVDGKRNEQNNHKEILSVCYRCRYPCLVISLN